MRTETTMPPVVALSRRMQHQAGRAMLWLRPDGWQARSRRNAWLAMVDDRQRQLDRQPADSAAPRPARTPQVRAGA